MLARSTRRRIPAVVVLLVELAACVADPGSAYVPSDPDARTAEAGAARLDVVVDDAPARGGYADPDARADEDVRGGLSGDTLAGQIRIRAFDAVLGEPIADALVVIGATPGTTARTSTSGVVEIAGVVGTKVTVTVAAACFSPRTYVDVPVDTVTVYLAPDTGIACASSDPQQLPLPGVAFGSVEGELRFPGTGWGNVPAPRRATERQAAYVLLPSRDPGALFVLPPASEATTPDDLGTAGYRYALPVPPGNATLYVLAGLEDRSVVPPSFVPYAMGVARGLSVTAQARLRNVDIVVDALVDHEVTVTATPPAATPRGPDRLTASVAMTLGVAGYAIFPHGTRTVPLPPPPMSFVVPALLAGESYVLGGITATGPSATPPASVVARVATTSASATLGVWTAIPVLGEPGAGVWSGTRIAFASPNADLARIDVVAGTRTWTIFAPGATTAFDLPHLPEPVALSHGAVTTTVYVARIDGFSYATLREEQLHPGAWSAYALDAVSGVH